MNSFQPSTLFPPVQHFPVPYFVYPHFDKNQVFPQNDNPMVKMEPNDLLSGSNMNPFHTIPSIHIAESSSQEYSQGRWTQEEERLYAEFIKKWEREHNFPDNSERKRRFYFNAMSGFIGTRSGAQCRSHDQKVREKKKRLIKEERPDPKVFEKLEEMIKKEEYQGS